MVSVHAGLERRALGGTLLREETWESCMNCMKYDSVNFASHWLVSPLNNYSASVDLFPCLLLVDGIKVSSLPCSISMK